MIFYNIGIFYYLNLNRYILKMKNILYDSLSRIFMWNFYIEHITSNYVILTKVFLLFFWAFVCIKYLFLNFLIFVRYNLRII